MKKEVIDLSSLDTLSLQELFTGLKRNYYLYHEFRQLPDTPPVDMHLSLHTFDHRYDESDVDRWLHDIIGLTYTRNGLKNPINQERAFYTTLGRLFVLWTLMNHKAHSITIYEDGQIVVK